MIAKSADSSGVVAAYDAEDGEAADDAEEIAADSEEEYAVDILIDEVGHGDES